MTGDEKIWTAVDRYAAESLLSTDPILAENGCTTVYWKTGHSYIKRKTAELNALAGFEKSGHFFLSQDLGRGYDCALTAAAALPTSR